MKSFFSLCAVLALLVILFFIFVGRSPVPDLLELVPAESLVVVDWAHPARDYQSFVRSSLGRQLNNMDRAPLLKSVGGSRASARVEEMTRAWKRFARSPLFQNFFQGRTVLALLPQEGQNTESAPLLVKNTVLLNHAARQASLFRLFAKHYSEVEPLPSLLYQGYTLHGYLLKKRYPLYFVTDKSLLIAGFKPSAVERCLDLLLDHFLEDGGGMAGNASYLALKKRARGEDDFFTYVDISALRKAQDSMSGEPSPEVRTLAVFHQTRQSVQQFSAILHYEGGSLGALRQRVYARAPIVNQHLAYMPENLQLYFWSNWLDAPAWWQAIRAEKAWDSSSLLGRFSTFIRAKTGRSVADISALLGSQVGLNIKEISSSGFLPVPRICFCVELKDREAMQSIMEKILTNVPVRHAMIAGVPVVSVLAAGGLMQPSYALLKKYLILADGRDQLEDILLPYDGMLVHDPDFRALDMGMQEANNLVFFARSARILRGVQAMASWVKKNIALGAGERGRANRAMLEHTFLPLLDGLTMIKSMAVRSYSGQNEMVLRAAFLLSEEKK